METAQKHGGVTCKMIFTPVNTHYAYIIHSFQSIIENEGAINYLYESMYNITDRIKEQKPSLMDWSVTITVVMTMQQIVLILIKTRPLVGTGSYLRKLFIL